MPSTLTVVGLGPGNPAQRTLEAAAVLETATKIVLRTAVHPGLDDFANDPRVSSCDDLYESAASFDELYSAIAGRVLAAAREGDVVFAVPGHPLIGERAVTRLLANAAAAGITIRIVVGVSAIDAVAAALQCDPMADEAQLIDAAELQRFVDNEPFNGALPDLSPLRPILLSQVYSAAIASAAKLALGRLYPDDHPIVIVSAAGIAHTQQVTHCRLFELDRRPVDHLTSVWIPRMESLAATRWPLSLHHIAARLRAPNGCPWDREQTYESLRRTVIEEAYEVASAIDEGDPQHLADELGDLLLHVAMQAQIGEEAGDFSIGDVYDHVNRKLVRRHPHVFGEVTANTADEVVTTWDAVKAKERAGQEIPEDPFDRLPRSMPVTLRVAKVLRKGAVINDTGNASDPGQKLLKAVQLATAAGLDPDVELERAYRVSRGELRHQTMERSDSA
jgi:tetrapyrrole methylase family protein / MazG family protein